MRVLRIGLGDMPTFMGHWASPAIRLGRHCRRRALRSSWSPWPRRWRQLGRWARAGPRIPNPWVPIYRIRRAVLGPSPPLLQMVTPPGCWVPVAA